LAKNEGIKKDDDLKLVKDIEKYSKCIELIKSGGLENAK
jgi:hypothetical protein